MYAFNLEYHHENGHKSSVIGAGTELDRARNDLAKHIEYYSTECPVIIDLAEIVCICPNCKGNGEFIKYWKKSNIVTKRTPCKLCNGNGSTRFELWEIK